MCKPGGVVGFTTWLTEGFSGGLFRTIGGMRAAARYLVTVVQLPERGAG